MFSTKPCNFFKLKQPSLKLGLISLVYYLYNNRLLAVLILIYQQNVDLTLRRLEMNLIPVFLTRDCRKLWTGHFQLRTVGPLYGEECVSLKGAADVLVRDVQQLMIRDVIRHITYALLNPLKIKDIH